MPAARRRGGRRSRCDGPATVNGPVGWLEGDRRRHSAWPRYGRAMTEELCRRLRTRLRTLSLVATDAGRPLYERLGSASPLTTTRWTRSPGPHARSTGRAKLRPLEPDDLLRVFELDRLATAEDRHAILASWRLPVAGCSRVKAMPACAASFCRRIGRSRRSSRRFEDGLCLLDLHRHLTHRNPRSSRHPRRAFGRVA